MAEFFTDVSEPVRHAVAAGAGAQAAQHAGLSLVEAAGAWGLGAGDDVESAPGTDAAEVRDAYRRAAAAAAGSAASTPAGTAAGATRDGRSARSG